uniref:Uncharacterized protein n=2 Tax=Anopheles atroparvus TaxID=41427 RepID=A0A182JEZ0_ANOAO
LICAPKNKLLTMMRKKLTMSIFKEINKHFSKVSRCKTRVRCNYCTVYIDVAKDMVAVCKKHLYRAHPSVFNGKDFGEYNPDEKQLIRERKAKKRDIQKMARNLKLSSEETWKHFIRMQGTTRARCNYCHTVISYSEGSASNCKRHLYRKHALILLKDPSLGNATEVKVEEILYEEDLDASTFISSFNPSLPSTDDDTTVKEVQFVKNPYLSEPIRIEIQGTVSPNDEQGDLDASENVGDYQELSGSGNIEVIEQLIQSDDPYLSDDGHSRSVSPVTDSNMQIVKYFSLRDPGVEALDPIGVEGSGKRRPIKAEQAKVKKESLSVSARSETVVNSQRSSLANTSHGSRSGLDSMKNFLDRNNVSIRSTMAATTMALALHNMPGRQKIIAEKLIGEVLFHGKRGALTEHAMVLGRASTFEYEYV